MPCARARVGVGEGLPQAICCPKGNAVSSRRFQPTAKRPVAKREPRTRRGGTNLSRAKCDVRGKRLMDAQQSTPAGLRRRVADFCPWVATHGYSQSAPLGAGPENAGT
jgi:hypothetical protein